MTMIPVSFNKDDARAFLTAIDNGTPIEPPEAGRWTVEKMIALAGALRFAAGSHGPVARDHWDWSKMHSEDRGAIMGQLSNDLSAAIEFCTFLTKLVRYGDYDEMCEPSCLAKISVIDVGERKLRVVEIEGFKTQ